MNITDSLEKVCDSPVVEIIVWKKYFFFRITLGSVLLYPSTEVELQLQAFLKTSFHWLENCTNQLAKELNRDWIIAYFTERDK